MAKEKGYFADEGLELKILPYSGANTDVLVAQGKADLGVSFVPQVLVSRASGIEVKAVAAIASKNTESLAVLDDSKFQSPKDLATGTTYGGFGLPYEVPTWSAVISGRTAATEVDFKNVTLNTAAYEALYAKKIDWSAIFDAWEGIEAEQRGIKLRTFPISKYLGEAGNYPSAIFVASDKEIADDPEKLEKGLARAVEGLRVRGREPGRVGEDPDRRRPGARGGDRAGQRQRGVPGADLRRRQQPVGRVQGGVLLGARRDPRRGRRAEGRIRQGGHPDRLRGVLHQRPAARSVGTRSAGRAGIDPARPVRVVHAKETARMPDRIIIRNGTVVTMNDADDVHLRRHRRHRGRPHHRGGGDRATPRTRPDGATVIDATDKAVLPGLVDLHYHTALGKGWSDHLPLWEYLQTCWYPIIRALEPGGGLLGGARELQRVDQVRRHDGQRHVPPARGARRRGRGDRDPRGALATTSPTTSTTSTRSRTTSSAFEQKHGAANGRIEVLHRHRVAAARVARSCCGTPARSPTSSAPASTST